MKVHARRIRSVEAALQRLATKFGPDVLFLPIEVVDSKTCAFPIACIDSLGIKLTDLVVDQDPLNLEVYIAHEIMHEVVEDEYLNTIYPSSVLSQAYDYKINQYLETFGYNVLNVAFKGLRNVQFDYLTLEQVCNSVVASKSENFVRPLRHPLVIQIAHALRESLGLRNVHPEILKFNFRDAYYSELRKHYPEFKFHHLPNINPDIVVRNLWVRHFQLSPKWDHSGFGKTLSPTQVLSIVPYADKIDTSDDAELSMFAALHVINTLNSSEDRITSRIRDIKKRISRAKDALYDKRHIRRKLRKNPDEYEANAQCIKALKLRIAKLLTRLQYFESLPKIDDLLISDNAVRVRRFDPKISSLGSTHTLASDEPRYDRSHPLVRFIRLMLKQASSEIAEIEDLYAKVKDFAEDFADDSEHEPETAETEVGESGEVSEDPSVEKNSASVEEPNAENGTEEPGATDDAPSASDVVQSNQAAADKDDSGIERESQNSGSAKGECLGHGSGSGGGGKLSTLNTLSANPKIFQAILKTAHEFGEKLLVKPSFKASDDGMIDRTLTFGTDLTRLPASELGRLGSEYARLSFLVDLANGNLLQFADLDPRRGPIVLMLDCSGSMGGRPYEIAAAFCLSMIQKLHKSKRGLALIKFSGSVDSVHVWNKSSKPPTLSELVAALLQPSMGGTDFNSVLCTFFKVCIDNNWANAQGLLVSDGYGEISDATKAKKPPGLKTTAVLVNRRPKISWFDECINVSRSGMELELVRIGNSLM